MKYTIHSKEYFTSEAKVIRWVDGDTVEVMVNPWHDNYVLCRVRLADINTPERGKPNYKEATNYASNLAPPGSDIVIETYKDERTYNRFVGIVYNHDEVNINDAMVASGFAVVDIH